MYELKPLSKEAIPRALEKAERYRLLNEPGEAESICLDVLEVEPDHQKALVTLLLALSDQFEAMGTDIQRARALLARLKDGYEQAYYAGILCERWAKAIFGHGAPGAAFAAYGWIREALAWYEKAEALRPPGNDDARLRWNACVRMLTDHPQIQPHVEEALEPPLE